MFCLRMSEDRKKPDLCKKRRSVELQSTQAVGTHGVSELIGSSTNSKYGVEVDDIAVYATRLGRRAKEQAGNGLYAFWKHDLQLLRVMDMISKAFKKKKRDGTERLTKVKC